MTDTNMRILQVDSCESISGSCSLKYELGCSPDNKMFIRITNSSGNGFFNSSWYSIGAILKALAKGRKGDPLTSYLLDPLIKGSANTAPFVMAALCNERLLRVLKGKKRGHVFLDPEGFDARMQKLVSAKGTTSSAKKKAPVRKAPRKKAAKTT